MPRKKKNSIFKLDPEWLLKEPIDFEYNKYTLLDYLQKCEKNFENFQIYPDFIELSLHLANLQSIIKENTLLLTQKKFEDIDDEILLKELYSKKMPEIKEEEKDDLNRTLKFSTNKLFDTFNIGKSIWNVVYDNITVSLKKNKNNLETGQGYVCHHDKENGKIMIWEYMIKKSKNDKNQNKTYFNLIFDSTPGDKTLNNLIDEFTTWKDIDGYKKFPVFEVKSHQRFPMKETFVPMMRRKIMSYVFQVVNMKKMINFDEVK
jgi:hypothetical protein